MTDTEIKVMFYNIGARNVLWYSGVYQLMGSRGNVFGQIFEDVDEESLIGCLTETILLEESELI